MSQFEDYSEYYEMFYRSKNYKEEVEYLLKLRKQYSQIELTNWLNIGCGTGSHEEFINREITEIDSFDLSEKMINKAKQKQLSNVNFFVSDIKNFSSTKKYSIVTSLFHVLSYQNSNESVIEMFDLVYKHLLPGGIFIFDFWYGPGVLTDPPVLRKRTEINNKLKVIRNAIPEFNINQNIVKIKYDFEVFHNEKFIKSFSEKHNMRYFFEPELKMFLKNSNLELINCFKWMEFSSPLQQDWNAVIIGRKKG